MLDQLAVSADSMTVAQMLERYRTLKAPSWSPSTIASFPHHAAPILAELGGTEVSRVRRSDIEAVYARWIADGVSPATVKRRHVALAAAFRQAERWEMVVSSPARDVEIDAAPSAAVMDLPEMDATLEAITRLDHKRLAVAAWLAVTTGARRGELVALRWGDVADGVARFGGAMSVGADYEPVRKGTKGGKPKVVGLDAATVAVLTAWHDVVVAEAAKAGFVPSAASYVLPSPSDPTMPWHPAQVSLQWRRKRGDIGLDTMKFHGLRHLHATYLTGENVQVGTVSGRLGHATKSMTLDLYSHARPADDDVAVAAITRATTGVRAGWVAAAE